MVLAIWLAMQNSSCMGISKRALLKVTARMEACARLGGTRKLVTGRSMITHVPIECLCCKLMPEQLQSTNEKRTLCTAAELGVSGASASSLRDKLQIPERSQHCRAISLIVAPTRLPELPASLGELGSWELQMLLFF